VAVAGAGQVFTAGPILEGQDDLQGETKRFLPTNRILKDFNARDHCIN
jgi:hypothetical protein